MSTQPTSSRSGERGFTLVESMVAIVVLAGGALALAALLIRASRTATVAASTVQATAALSTEVGRLTALPFEELPDGTTCVEVNEPPYPHTRCTTVNNISAKEKELIVVVTPSGNPLLKPDTVRIRRSKGGGSQALNKPNGNGNGGGNGGGSGNGNGNGNGNGGQP